jgi:hypothetical protein
MPRLRRTSIGLAIAIGAVATCDGIREDELECEEAVAHLRSCCPGFDVHAFHCEYIAGCLYSTYPDLDVGTSQCIRELDCDTVVASKLCEISIVRSTDFAATPVVEGAGRCQPGGGPP